MSISHVDGEDYNVKYFEYELENSVEQYKDKDLILCCFAVNDVDSYNKLDSEYLEEVGWKPDSVKCLLHKAHEYSQIYRKSA